MSRCSGVGRPSDAAGDVASKGGGERRSTGGARESGSAGVKAADEAAEATSRARALRGPLGF